MQWLLKTRVGSIVAFPITLVWNLSVQRSNGLTWYNQITSNIILGGYPTNGVFNELVKNDRLRGVVSVLSSHELLFTPTEQQWKKHGVEQCLIPCYDFDMIPLEEDVVRAINFIDGLIALDATNQIYIHCKAGKGRSVLIAKHKISVEEAIALIKSFRPQINLGEEQLKFAMQFSRKYLESN